MNLTRNQIIIIGIGVLIVIFFVLLFIGVIPGLKTGGGNLGPSAGNQLQLNIWGVVDGGDFNDINLVVDEYSKINKGVSVSYRQFDDMADYEKTLVNALATGQAPDIFMFHNTWLPKHYDKVAPFPETVFTLSQLQQLFPKVVEQDFVSGGKVCALPLYIDTLALIYNKDVFDAKTITTPPVTWSDFQSLVPRLRQLNVLNQVSKAAAAIGGSEKSVHAASDMISLLMMQFGNQMTLQQGKIMFGPEALTAFNFYLQFANPSGAYYTWNNDLTYSLNSFSQGQTAIIFDYASQLPLIKEKNPYLDIGISPMPQTADTTKVQPVNFANYWGLAVSGQSQKQTYAWNFTLFVTANPDASNIFLQSAKKPPALRALIEKYKNDPTMGVFAKQALTARSWSQPDNNAVKQIFSNMIESVLEGRLASESALQKTQNEISALLKK